MASPCTVLIEVDSRQEAERILSVASTEARRIESKFSRYVSDNVIHAINHGQGRAVAVDEETARLFDFAQRLHELSDGKFDITSGVLRRAWTFDGSDRVPTAETVADVLRHVGWHRVRWDGGRIQLQPEMEIDLGGIGKEYAVDRAAQDVAAAHPGVSCVVNFGGDLVLTRPRRNLQPWRVGIEDTAAAVRGKLINITAGGLATSGDAHRYLLKDGVRYSHILDPTTGWPVHAAPRSVTVAAGSCVDAGMMATLAMLQGEAAEDFLEAQGAEFWIAR